MYCRAVISLPCVKGGGSRKRVGGIVKNKILSKNNPSVTFGDSSLYTREPYVSATKQSPSALIFRLLLQANGCNHGIFHPLYCLKNLQLAVDFLLLPWCFYQITAMGFSFSIIFIIRGSSCKCANFSFFRFFKRNSDEFSV